MKMTLAPTPFAMCGIVDYRGRGVIYGVTTDEDESGCLLETWDVFDEEQDTAVAEEEMLLRASAAKGLPTVTACLNDGEWE